MPVTHYTNPTLYPRHLSPEEELNPLLTLQDFFQFADLAEHRELLRETFDTLVSSGWHSLSPKECDGLVCLHRHIEKLVEACYLLLQQNRYKENAGERK